jgi:metal-responsive CopG/Arc/MetJ family transcriptional regulator
MKQKTSMSLSEEVLRELDRYAAGNAESRSAYIERVLREHFPRRARVRINSRDRHRINAAAERLNAEAAEVLEDQASRLVDD